MCTLNGLDNGDVKAFMFSTLVGCRCPKVCHYVYWTEFLACNHFSGCDLVPICGHKEGHQESHWHLGPEEWVHTVSGYREKEEGCMQSLFPGVTAHLK